MIWNKSTWAKIFGWLLGAIGTLAGAGAFGKYTNIAMIAVSVLTTAGIHVASNTSSGHPNG